jgi:hypothetical protein
MYKKMIAGLVLLGSIASPIYAANVFENLTHHASFNAKKITTKNPAKFTSFQKFIDFSGKWLKASCTGDATFDGPLIIKNDETHFTINNKTFFINAPLLTETYSNPKIGETEITHSLSTWSDDGTQLILKSTIVEQYTATFPHIQTTLTNVTFSLNNAQLVMQAKAISYHDLGEEKGLGVSCTFNRIG